MASNVDAQSLEKKEALPQEGLSSMSTADLYKAAAIAEGYESVPVGIEQFLNDPHYLGQIYGGAIYPYWMDCLKQLYPNPLYSPYIECCITGAIGIGKTSIGIVGLLYDLYHVILLKDPHKKYKLIPTTPIVISLITATMDLAGAVIADQLLDAIGASPWFLSKLCPGKGEHLDEDMFPHHVGIAFGSRMRHSLGKAVIGAIIDEANFQDAVSDQAMQNYNSIRRRMFSRFMTKGGCVPCRMWVLSSRNESASFLETHIDAERGNPAVAVYEPAIWEVQWHKGIYCGKMFTVFIGSDLEQPKILTTDKELEEYAGMTIQVPVEYRKDFENNLPGALKDLAGVATRNGVNLIYNISALDKCLCLTNSVASDELRLTLDGEDQISDYYKKGAITGSGYYCHIDGAIKGDRLGFALSRVTSQLSVKATSAIDGSEEVRLTPGVETPISFGIRAMPGSEIPLWKVRKFLLWLRNEERVGIAQVSCDGFQSADMLQLLAKLGFLSKYVSVDRTKDAYLKLSSNVTLGVIKLPKSPILRTELINLQNLPNKIDHPDVIVVDGKQIRGSKDIADAVAASSHEAIAASMTLSQSSLINMTKQPIRLSEKQKQAYVLKNFLHMG